MRSMMSSPKSVYQGFSRFGLTLSNHLFLSQTRSQIQPRSNHQAGYRNHQWINKKMGYQRNCIRLFAHENLVLKGGNAIDLLQVVRNSHFPVFLLSRLFH